MLINILGCDGCGKSTQVKMLSGWLSDYTGLPVSCVTKRDVFEKIRGCDTDFLGVSYAKFAYEIMPGMSPEVRSLMMVYLNLVVKQHLDQGAHITLLDGYWHKHFSTELALGMDRGWVSGLCSVFNEPDLNILIDVDPRALIERGHSPTPYEAGCDFTRSNDGFIRHQTKVRSELRKLAAERSYPIVDGAGSREEILEKIKGAILKKLTGEDK